MNAMPKMGRQTSNRLRPDAPITEPVSDRYLLQLFARFLRPYWVQLLVVFALLLGVTLLTLLPPYLIQRAVDGPIKNADLNGLLPYGAIYFGSIMAIFVLRFGHTYLLQTVGQNALMNIRQELFEHILQQDMAFFNTTPVGQIVSRLSNDIDALTELLSTSIVMVASNMMTLVGIIVVMFHPGGVQVESFGDDKLPGFVPPPEAVGKMIRTIDGLTLKDSGRFMDNDGKDHPW